MARRPELTVLPCRRDLGEHVLIEVALRVAILHRDFSDEVDNLRKQLRGGDREPRVLHVMCVRRTIATERPKEWEDVSINDGEHLVWGKVPKPGPAHVLVGASQLVLPLWEDSVLQRPLESRGLVLLQDLHVVETTQEE